MEFKAIYVLALLLLASSCQAQELLETKCTSLLNGDLTNIIKVADVDADGKPNILVGTKINGNLLNYVYQGADCTLDWTYTNGGWTFDTPGDVKSFVVSDLDGDGRPQVVINSISSSYTQNTVKEYVYVVKDNGLLDWNFNKECGLSNSVAAADLDASGTANVILGSKSKKVCALQDDTKVKSPVLWTYMASEPVEHIMAQDIDGDGKQDVLGYAGKYKSGELFLLDSQGKEKWTVDITGGMYTGINPYNAIKTGMLSKVGPPSILIGTYESGLRAYSGAGSLLWEFKTGNLISAVAAIDIDGDGDDEVVMGSAPNIYILDGQGKELAKWSTGSEKTIYSISGADIDGDGKKEIAVGTTRFIYILDDDGTKYGEWKYTVEIQGLTKAYEERDANAVSIVMEDLDSDGYPEVIAAWNWEQGTNRGNQYSSTLRVYEINKDYKADKPTTVAKTVMTDPPSTTILATTKPVVTTTRPVIEDDETEDDEEESGMCCLPFLPAILAGALAILLRIPMAVRR